MIFWILSVLFIIFQSASNSNVKDFIEIKISHNNSIKNRVDLSVSKFNDSNECHVASKWMEDRDQHGKGSIVCQVRTNHSNCYCSLRIGNCFDFNEVMEVIYMMPRDKVNSAVPRCAFNGSESIKDINSRIPFILNLLHKNSLMLSKRLYQHNDAPSDSPFEDSCKTENKTIPSKKLDKLENREEVTMEVTKCDTDFRLDFFSRGTYNLYDNGPAILRIREKLLEQIRICENSTSEKHGCELDLGKKKVKDKLDIFLQFAKSNVKIVSDPRIGRHEISEWPLTEGRGSVSGIMLTWIIALLLIILFFAVIRSSCSDESIEERKPLNTHKFKLTDIEKKLKKELSGKHPDKSGITFLAKLDLEKALKSDKRRQQRRKGAVFKSIQMITPKEESDLESMNRRSLGLLNLQQTQQDLTEYIGTAIEIPKSAKQNSIISGPNPAAPTTKPEKSVLSKTDQGTFVNKEKSDEVIRLRSIQKTQSPTPEQDAMPIVPPKVVPTPQSNTPLGQQFTESKRTRRKRSTSKSVTPGKVNQKRSKMKPKDKKHWYNLWN
ncbi:unnamed protein product [Caenorhabditis brenneri]